MLLARPLPNSLVKIGTCSLKLKGPLQGPILVPEKWLEAIGLPIFEEQSKIALGSATSARMSLADSCRAPVAKLADRNKRPAKLDCSFFLKWAPLNSLSPSVSHAHQSRLPERKVLIANRRR